MQDYNRTEKSLYQWLKELPVGSVVEFPMEKMRTISNYVSLLNKEQAGKGVRWKKDTDPEGSTIVLTKTVQEAAQTKAGS